VNENGSKSRKKGKDGVKSAKKAQKFKSIPGHKQYCPSDVS
jgi:hypothetical protein